MNFKKKLKLQGLRKIKLKEEVNKFQASWLQLYAGQSD